MVHDVLLLLAVSQGFLCSMLQPNYSRSPVSFFLSFFFHFFKWQLLTVFGDWMERVGSLDVWTVNKLVSVVKEQDY